jgi:ketosteroid isomerase-like protein
VSRHDGVEVDLRGASVWTMREGRIARVEFHTSRDVARAAFDT